jgi:hypothetical protein
MHIEVWGSAERDHSYREEIYKKNDYNVIFVHAYKHHKDWKKFLIKRIMEIEEQRHQRSHENANQQNNLTLKI